MLLTHRQPWTFQLALQQTENNCNCWHFIVADGNKGLLRVHRSTTCIPEEICNFLRFRRYTRDPFPLDN